MTVTAPSTEHTTPTRTGRAVLYLRVSTPSQVQTDYDPEGLSIPAQRRACQRKAEQLGLAVVDEYVEPGRTATSMDKRPAFQAMLARIKSERDVDSVIVYKLSRMNRNRIDDALVVMSLRQLNVSLISATEHIDATPVGQLMHGILATINEFRSAEDGADIRYKMGEKARRGGTPTLAPIGYLNVREQYEGREVRTVTVDPDRSEHITWAFEAYATGNYSLTRLVDELAERGLRTRPTLKRPAHPLTPTHLQKILTNRYYTGVKEYEGVEYPGRHAALVTPDVFEAVQTVLVANRQGEKTQRHPHYLKSTIYCGRCGSRLGFTRARGKCGGLYDYFFCLGRHGGNGCRQRFLAVDVVELEVERFYASVRLDQARADEIRDTIRHLLNRQASAQEKERKRQQRRLAGLADERTKLLHAHTPGRCRSTCCAASRNASGGK